MILVVAVLAVLICLAGLLFYRSTQAIPFMIGVLVSSGASVLKLLLLERMMKQAANSKGQYPSYKVYLHYFLRFALTAGVLLIAGLVSLPALIGAACGIFTLPLSGFAMKFFPDLN